MRVLLKKEEKMNGVLLVGLPGFILILIFLIEFMYELIYNIQPPPPGNKRENLHIFK